MKAAAGQYALMPHYRRQLEAMGLADVAATAARSAGAGNPAGVPADLIRALCLTGAPSAAIESVAASRMSTMWAACSPVARCGRSVAIASARSTIALPQSISVPGGLSYVIELGALFDLALVVTVAAAFTERIHLELGTGDTELLRGLRD